MNKSDHYCITHCIVLYTVYCKHAISNMQTSQWSKRFRVMSTLKTRSYTTAPPLWLLKHGLLLLKRQLWKTDFYPSWKHGPRTLRQFNRRSHVQRLRWHCGQWEERAVASILSPGLRLWSSTSRQSWSLEQEHSRAQARTPAPPHREQPVGPAEFPRWKPSLRSKKNTHISMKQV